MTILIAVKEPGEDWVYQERETAPTYQELADLVGWPGHAFCKCEYEFDLVSNSAPQHEGLESNITRGVHGSPLDVLCGTVIAVRRDEDGNIIPRSIINRFVADFNGQNIIDVTLEPSISTNPYFAFDAVVPEAGEFFFTWYDDDGSIYEAKKPIKIV